MAPMMSWLNMTQEGREDHAHFPEIRFCKEKNRLLKELLTAIHELMEIQNQQTLAVINGDPDFARFDVLLHMAHERKQEAKYAWIAHVQSHHCEEA
jgi:hypothetical protein